MGLLRQLLTGVPDPVLSAAADPGPVFAVDAGSIDPAVFGMTSYADPVAYAPRVDRRSAIQVPAVKRARDLVAGSLGTLPVDLFDPGRNLVRERYSALFDQPEAGTTRTRTMTLTVEDMLFEGVAWWRVRSFGWHGYPDKVERLRPGRVSVDEDRGVVLVDGQAVPDSQLIRFDSPNDALLASGARAIRTCLRLDSAAALYSDGTPPMTYFTPTEGADPADDGSIVDLLDSFQEVSRARTTAYIPAAVKLNTLGWNPEQLQMAEARQHAVLEIARAAGVDPEDLGVSTTSRTYANQFDRRKAFIDFTLGGYLSALQDRLSMNDVCPRGYYVRLNLDAFLRSDALTRYQAYEVGKRAGALTDDEVRLAEDKPPLTEAQRPQPPALPAPAPEEATA